MKIILDNISVRFPLFDAEQRSFRRKILSTSTGGRIVRASTIPYVEALSQISLKIQQGDRISLIGPNGSGKTTLLRVLAGVYEPDIGKIIIQGRVTSLLDPHLGLDLEATGYENIQLKGLLLGLKMPKIKALIPWVQEFSELGDFLAMPVRTYSSGMLLRLAFSIITSITPEILLMDEWISVGDDNFKRKAENRMLEIVNAAGIVVIATHDITLAKRLNAKIIQLQNGKIHNMRAISASYLKESDVAT